jgi:hypothetical protein
MLGPLTSFSIVFVACEPVSKVVSFNTVLKARTSSLVPDKGRKTSVDKFGGPPV